MLKEHCLNNNHTRMNVPVRHCPMCGEIVNRKIPNSSCTKETHSKRRKNRDKFCLDCGKDLTL